MGRGGIVVIYDDKMLEVNKHTNTKLRSLYEGGSGIILTLGDGDFSFSAAIASQFNLRSGDGTQRLLATSYDSQSQVMQKYTSTAGVCLDTLKKMQVPTLHNIDATKLYQTLEVNRYRTMKRPDTLPIPQYVKNCSRVIFNFPNLGNLGANSTQIHQDLLKNFFIQCLPLLVRPNARNRGERGEVHVALRNSPFYEKWDIEAMAVSIGYKLLEKGVFKTDNYPGYEEQRTNPGILRAAPPKADGASIYRFIIDDQYIDHLEMAGYMDVTEIDTTNLNAYTKSIMPTEISDAHDMEAPINPLAHLLSPLVKLDVVGQGDSAPAGTGPGESLIKHGKSDCDEYAIAPNQLVGFKLDTSALRNGKLSAYKTTHPPGTMQYRPVYPRCPTPPTADEIKTGGDGLKKFNPSGLFSFYHSQLSTAPTTSRNFRLGVQELNDIWETTNEALKVQMKAYSSEALANGALLIRPVRASNYENYYRAALIDANKPKKVDSANDETATKPGKGATIQKKAIVTKLVSVKKMINGKMITVKVPEKQAAALKEAKSDTVKDDETPKWDLPFDQRLYVGYIVGVIAPENAVSSTTHLKSAETKLAGIRKAASQNIEGDDAVNQKNKHSKQQANGQQQNKTKKGEDSMQIDEHNLASFLGGSDSTSLAYQLATAGASHYKLGMKEKEQLKRQGLLKVKEDSFKKKLEWQAERRVKHCEDKGTEARPRDLKLVTQLRSDKEAVKQARNDRKQERRIERATQGK